MSDIYIATAGGLFIARGPDFTVWRRLDEPMQKTKCDRCEERRKDKSILCALMMTDDYCGACNE